MSARVRPWLSALVLCVAPGAVNAAAPPGPRPDRHGDPLPRGALARLGSVRFRPRERVFCLAVSPDGKLLATGGLEGGRVWDARTGRPQAALRAEGRVLSVAFSADGRSVLASTDRGQVYRWLAHTGEPVGPPLQTHTHGHYQPWSADGRRCLIGLAVWDVPTDRALYRVRRQGLGLASPALSPDGKRVAFVRSVPSPVFPKSRAPWHELQVVDVDTGKEVIRDVRAGENDFRGLRFSPDGRWLVAVKLARLHFYDIAGRKWLPTVRPGTGLFVWLALAPDGRHAAVMLGRSSTGHPETLELWALPAGKLVHRLAPAPDRFNDVCFSADGRSVYAATVRGQVRVWDVATGKERLPPDGTASTVVDLCWAEDGRAVFTASDDGMVRRWDARTGRLTSSFGPFEGLARVQGTRDGRLLLISTITPFSPVHLRQSASVWRLVELPSGRERPLPAWVARGGWWLVLSPDGRWVACGDGSNPGVKVWDVAARQCRHALPTELAVDYHLVYSRDGRYLCAVDQGGLVYLWELGAGLPRLVHRASPAHVWPRPAHVISSSFVPAFSPDGRALLYLLGDRVILCETATGQVRARLSADVAEAVSVPGLPEATLLIDYRVGAWAGRPRPGVVGWGLNGGMMAAVSPDGNRLAATAPDGNVLIWDLRYLLPAPVQARALTPAEAARCWARLAGGKADEAFTALEALAGDPARAVPLLASRLTVPPAPDERRLARLVADLGADEFAARAEAEAKLARLGENAVEPLRQALAAGPSLHARRTIERLLRAGRPGPQQVAILRALEALEHCGTPEARAVLVKLGGEKAAPWFRREVRAALERWPARPR